METELLRLGRNDYNDNIGANRRGESDKEPNEEIINQSDSGALHLLATSLLSGMKERKEAEEDEEKNEERED